MTYDYSWLDGPTLVKFKAEYEKAKQAGDETFTFEIRGKEHDVVTAFAKYLIEYKEMETSA